VDHCCVQGWTGALGGSGNFDADPLLVRRGFRLRPESPCIDAGSGDGDWSDFDGESVVPGGVPDVGADEFIDSDGNGLADRWEDIHYGVPTGCDPDSDTDFDGLTAREEYDLNTSPVVPRGVYYVDTQGNDSWDGMAPTWDGTHGPKRTIQAAVDATRPDEVDVVVIRDGVYKGPGNRGVRLPYHDIVLCSENGPENCIIDCAKADRGLRVDRAQSPYTEIRGLTIRHGKPIVTGTSSAYGGGIYCHQADVTVDGCVISGCEANGSNGYGGGIYMRNSLGRVRDCFITGNTAVGSIASGGGIYLAGGRPVVDQCVLVDNRSRSTGHPTQGDASAGGGIGMSDTLAVVSDCLVARNTARFGGGISDLTVSESTTAARIERCEVRENVGVRGGGFYSQDAESLVLTNLFARNTSEYGGAIDFYGYGPKCPRVIQCVVAENSNFGSLASDWPRIGGISGFCVVQNTIVWGNHPVQAGESARLEYSLVQDGYAGTGNVDAMPWVALGQDWHLLPGSPGVDVGTNTPAGGLPAFDYEGVPRAQDGDGSGEARPDAGAHENVPGAPRLAVSPSWLDVHLPEGETDPVIVTLSVRNCGEGILDWQASENTSWLSLPTTSGQSAGDVQPLEVAVSAATLSPGRYLGFVELSSDGAAAWVKRVPVTVHIHAVREVPAQYATIQAAIDAASSGDSVVVSDGVYTGAGNKNLRLYGKRLIVRSKNGPENCVIDCEGDGSGFTIQDEEPCGTEISGFTIRNASASAVVISNGSPDIRNCRIVGNAGVDGGGIRYAGRFSSIEDCLIAHNEAANEGGGVYAAGSNLTVRNCVVSNNEAVALAGGMQGGGGGVSVRGGNVTIVHSRILDNVSGTVGGGLRLQQQSGTRLSHCVIAANSARSGAGVYVYQVQEHLDVVNCLVCGNVASEAGGGIAIDFGGNARMLSSTIVGNDGANWGGGLYCRQGDMIVRNCVITQNTAAQGDEAAVDFSGLLDIDHSALLNGQQGVWMDDMWADVQWGRVIPDDPRLRDPDGPDGDPATWEDGDYSLAPGSPCIDAGSNLHLPLDPDDVDGDRLRVELLPVDLAGQERLREEPTVPDSGEGTAPLVDIGAYEYQPVPGDLDGDGDVDTDDRAVFLSTYGRCEGNPAFLPAADYDGDGCVTLPDYQAWLADYRAFNTPPEIPPSGGANSGSVGSGHRVQPVGVNADAAPVGNLEPGDPTPRSRP